MVRLYSIGHGNLTLGAFAALLKENGIERLIDIRRHPRSRRNPHFNGQELLRASDDLSFSYLGLDALGGYRKRPRGESPHRALDRGMIGYAHYMATAEFRVAAESLTAEATNAKVAMMCAEINPANCHRNLLSDWLTVNGVEVLHIVGESAPLRHKVPSVVRIKGGVLIYDRIPEQRMLPGLE